MTITTLIKSAFNLTLTLTSGLSFIRCFKYFEVNNIQAIANTNNLW